MVEHHPKLEQLVEYCSGAMPLSHGICVATHVEYCDSCRQHVERLNQLGGVLLDSMHGSLRSDQMPGQQFEVDSSDTELKQRVFNLIDDDSPLDFSKPLAPAQPNSQGSDVPKSLRQFIGRDYSELKWTKVSFSIKLATLLRDKDGAQIAISRTEPGGKMFHHSHTGDEITVVLKGSFSDEDGIYKEGDFVFRDGKDKHTPLVTKDAECICLMVLGSPIQFTGLLTRFLNPLIRMNH